MKIFYTLILLLFLITNSYAQERCGFDQYNELLMQKYGEEISKREKEFKLFSKSQKGDLSAKNLESVTIPVVFHVVHNGEAIGQGSNVSDEAIEEQLEILNNDFSQLDLSSKLGFGAPTDSKIRFCLAKTDPFGQPTTGITRSFGSDYYVLKLDDWVETDNQIKLKRWPSNLYLNIYLADIRNEMPDPSSGDDWDLYAAQAYSTNPAMADFKNDAPAEEVELFSSIPDGIVLNYRHVIPDEYVGDLDLNSVLTHEAGHWLGLFHVFGIQECNFYGPEYDVAPNCEEFGDEICDTPPIRYQTTEQNNILNIYEEVNENCDSGELVSGTNFMDYSNKLNFFTKQQVERMHQKTSFYRPFIYQMTRLNSDCSFDNTIELNDGGFNGGSSGSGTCNGSFTDPYGFKITSLGDIGFGKSLSIDGEILVISDGSTQVNTFEIDGCDVSQYGTLKSSNSHEIFGRHVYIKNGKLFVSFDDDKVKIFEKENEFWVEKQTLYSSGGDFGRSILLKNDELIVTSENELIFYQFNGSQFVEQWGNYFQYGIGSYDNYGLAFNGDYIILRAKLDPDYFGKNAIIYYRDNNGIFIRTEESLPRVGAFALEDAPINKFHINTAPESQDVFTLKTYDLNSISSQEDGPALVGSFNLFNDFWSDGDRISRILVQNDLMILPRTGDGTTFNNKNVPTQNIIVSDGDGENNRFLTPYPYERSPHPYQSDRTLGVTSSVSGDYYVVGNYFCNEVYIYNINNLIFDDYDYQFCATPTGDVISGKNITLGNGTCTADFSNSGDGKTFKATDVITIKPGAQIGPGFSFKVENSCSLNGGMTINTLTAPFKADISSYNQDRSNDFNQEEEEFDILISPNPTNDKIIVTSPPDNNVLSCQIFNLGNANLFGYSNKKSKSQFELDFSTYPSGIYIINFNMQDGSAISKKIIKE